MTITTVIENIMYKYISNSVVLIIYPCLAEDYQDFRMIGSKFGITLRIFASFLKLVIIYRNNDDESSIL